LAQAQAIPDRQHAFLICYMLSLAMLRVCLMAFAQLVSAQDFSLDDMKFPPSPPPPPPPAMPGSPNIVWFLTDDQDQMLGGSFPMHNGVGPMPKTQKRLADEGAMAENWFIHTPICAPSRTELVSGRYFHNIKRVGGPWANMHTDPRIVNNQTFAYFLQKAGYRVGMFGKYLNNNPLTAPAGIEAYMTNGGGEYFAPVFNTQGVSDLAPYRMADGIWKGGDDDYTTAVVGNASLAWIRKVAHGPNPFFAYIAPKAAHEPFTPAKWYENYWAAEWPSTEPRPETWNCSAESRNDHHGNIATQPMITEQCADYVTKSFKDRWRTLMSVDDVIDEVVQLVEDMGVADNTYFMYSSDHGFQLGELNILLDKRQHYDYDTRIHLLMRGPGIKKGSTFKYPGTQVDIATTWMGIAGLDRPEIMDGRSIMPLLVNAGDKALPAATRAHVAKLAPNGREMYAANWRDHVFIEYYFMDNNAKCNGYNTEDLHNNFISIRHMPWSKFGDTSYTEFQSGDMKDTLIDFDDIDFVEYFNLTEDKWQFRNLAKTGSPSVQKALSKKLHDWYRCKGNSCGAPFPGSHWDSGLVV